MSLESDWAAATPVQADWEKATPVSGGEPPKKRRRGDMTDEPIAGALEPLLTMATGAIAKPVSDIAGLGAIPLHALGITSTDPSEVKNIVQSGMTYEPRTEMGKAMNLIPEAIGRGINWAATGMGNQAAKMVPDTSPNLRDAVRNAVAEAGMQAPMFLGMGGGVAKGALQGGSRFGAEGLMRSALKPDAAARASGADVKGFNTLLGRDESGGAGLVRRGYSENMSDTIGKIDDQLTDVIKNSTKDVSTAAIVKPLDKAIRDAMNDPDPAHLAIVEKVRNDFLNMPAIGGETHIPVQQAQAIKREMSKQLRKAYGKLSGPEESAKKINVMGLKDEIAAAEPAADTLNAQMSPLINAQNLVDQRIGVAGNAGPLGFSPIAHSARGFFAALGDRSPLVLSLLAHGMEGAGNAVGAGALPFGVAGTFEADQAARKRRLAELLGSK